MLKKILLKDFGDAKSNLISFCLFGVLGVLYLFSLNAENAINDSDIALLLFFQVMIITTFANYRVACVKKDLIEKFGKDNSLQNTTEPQSEMIYLKIAHLIILGLFVLGVTWHLVSKIWLVVESYNNI